MGCGLCDGVAQAGNSEFQADGVKLCTVRERNFVVLAPKSEHLEKSTPWFRLLFVSGKTPGGEDLQKYNQEVQAMLCEEQGHV